MKGAVRALGVALLGVAMASGAAAQVEAGPATATDAPGYRELVDLALAASEQERWTEAYALFARAHALEPNARTHRGMGVTAFESGHYLRSLAHLTAAQADARKPLTVEQQREVATTIQRIRASIARVELRLEPRNARVSVDGEPALFDREGRLLLDPGMRKVSASAAGRLTEQRIVQASAGSPRTLALRLRPEVAGPTAGSAAISATAPTTDLRWPWPALVAAGTAVAFAGAGAALLAVGHSGYDEIEARCPPGNCSEDTIDRMIDDEDLEALQVGWGVAFGLAGAAAATSIVLFVLDAQGDTDRGTAEARSLQLDWTGPGARARLRF